MNHPLFALAFATMAGSLAVGTLSVQSTRLPVQTASVTDTTLADGPPPLTRNMIDTSAGAMERWVEIELTAEDRADYAQQIVKAWNDQDDTAIGRTMEWIDLGKQICESPAEDLPARIERLRIESKHHADARWLLGRYDAKQTRPICAGDGRLGIVPLMPEMIRRFTFMMELAYDIQLDRADRRALWRRVESFWQNKQKAEIDRVLWWLEQEARASSLDHGNQVFVALRDIYPKLIAEAKRQTNLDAQTAFLMQIHDAQHKPLVSIDPPLRRRDAEAMLEVLFFAASVQEVGSRVHPTQEMLDAWVEQLAIAWPVLGESRPNLEPMRALWMQLEARWDRSDAPAQAAMKTTFEQMPQVAEVRRFLSRTRVASVARTERLQKSVRQSAERSRLRGRLTRQGRSMPVSDVRDEVDLLSEQGSGGAFGSLDAALVRELIDRISVASKERFYESAAGCFVDLGCR